MTLDTVKLQKLCEAVVQDAKGCNEGTVPMARDQAWAQLTHSSLPELEAFLSESHSEKPTVYPRPSTRGELRDRLANGESCEVATYVGELTEVMLKGWLGFVNFEVISSPNRGWSIFKPTK